MSEQWYEVCSLKDSSIRLHSNPRAGLFLLQINPYEINVGKEIDYLKEELEKFLEKSKENRRG